MKPKVYVVLVNYNGFLDTKECIESLSNITYENYEIIVVDNASTVEVDEETLSFIKEKAVYIESDTNIGFSGGNNIGIEHALKNGADYILLLNNDTAVEPDFLDVLVSNSIEAPNAGIVGGKIKYYSNPNMIWFGGGFFDRDTGKIGHERYNEVDLKSTNTIRSISFMTGCLMLIPVKIIQEVGKLEEKYFLYSEDTDYCCRVMDAGYDLLFCEDAVIYHKINASTGKSSNLMTYYTTRNKLFIARDFTTRPLKIYFDLSVQFIKDWLRRRKHMKPIISAYIDFIKNKSGKTSRKF